ncbi:hypothetical protein ACHAXS_006714 [Conticribra weissflogii]
MEASIGYSLMFLLDFAHNSLGACLVQWQRVSRPHLHHSSKKPSIHFSSVLSYFCDRSGATAGNFFVCYPHVSTTVPFAGHRFHLGYELHQTHSFNPKYHSITFIHSFIPNHVPFIFITDHPLFSFCLVLFRTHPQPTLTHTNVRTHRSHQSRNLNNISKSLRAEFARGDGRIKRKEDERRKKITPSETLFVVNFHEETTKREDLQMLFEPFGELVRIDMKRNYAFVQFRTVDEAQRAKDATNGGKLDQSEITVEFVARRMGEGDRRRDDRGGFRGDRGGYRGDRGPRRDRDYRRDDRYDDRGGYRGDRYGGPRDRRDYRRRSRSRSRSPGYRGSYERRRSRSPEVRGGREYDDHRSRPSYRRSRSPEARGGREYEDRGGRDDYRADRGYRSERGYGEDGR